MVTGSTPLLPTPVARDGRADGSPNIPGKNSTGTSLMKSLAMLPTPTRHMVKDTGAPSEFERKSLEITATKLNLLPTPSRSDGEKNQQRYGKGDLKLSGAMASLSTGAPTPPPSTDGDASTDPPRLRLAPEFVEWMLGVPPGWTDPDSALSVTEFASMWRTQLGLPSESTCRQDGGNDAD
jgi:hypothetical protein